MFTKSILHVFTLGVFVCLSACNSGIQHENKFIQWDKAEQPQEGIVWPKGQAIPQFAAIADTVDAIIIDRPPMSNSDVLMLTTLQGIINKTKPRVMLFNTRRGGKMEWADKLSINTAIHSIDQRWNLVKKYAEEIDGFVMYSPQKSIHYYNLASTIASVENCIAVTKAEYKSLSDAGVNLPVKTDISDLSYTKPTEIYTYLYENYWDKCTRRTFLSLSPNVVCDIRDMAVAVKAASVWLDPRIKEEKQVLELFLSDMKAGESVILGWWPEERSGIGAGTSHGISTIPSDFYDNSTIFAADPHIIFHAPVPKRKALDNKIYLSIFLSDGDNVQYCQHSMIKLWEDTKRGNITINWTVSPGLTDLGPGLYNYYNRTASPNDCFSSGPSGLGYALIYDAHNKVWFAPDRETIEPYTKFTQQYLEKSGLRTITIWDEISDEQAQAYADNCRYLYGLTEQDWQRGEPVETTTKNGRLAILPNNPCYVGNIDDIYDHWKDTLSTFTGDAPLFLTAQGVSWRLGPEDIARLRDSLNLLSPGNIEICRGDHFFSFYNEANGLDYNLTMSESTKITSSSSNYDKFVSDGSAAPEYRWTDADAHDKWIEFDFMTECAISRYVVRHAGFVGEDSSLNTKDFRLYVSNDKERWTLVDKQTGNTADVSDIDFPVVNARYAKIVIRNAGSDNVARIGDVEIYGKTVK